MLRSVPLAITLALALALTGCIQNMTDLKDRLGGADEEPIQAASTQETPPPSVETPATNATPKKPPVARMSLFAGGGALIYKSTFKADDPTEVVLVEEKSKLNAIAGDSETLETGATLAAYAWTLNGKSIPGGSQATVEVAEAGLYVLNLTVTDSNGNSDAHSVKLGVAPKPYDVVTELVTGLVVGAGGVGQSGEASFELALDASKGPVAIQAVTFTAKPGTLCDAILDVTNADGESIGSVDGGSLGEEETITAGALPPGTYAITVGPFACAAPDGVAVSVTVTYLPIIPGLGEGDGHGGHAGH